MERLARLIEEDECSASCEKYAEELKKLSEEVDKALLCKFGPLLFKALADRNRLKILKMLAVREMCVCELNVALDISQGTISHHLKILQEAKLVKGRVKGKWNYYQVNFEQIEKFMKISEQFLEELY
ncbi:MAG: winged helix-turn-helix transcriptional regulator [Candidatus Freyarchaeota archaeon]|nr:winged helix-turn-helix transcriptional regulator [Candidatus Jordarchaeia archaeon]MBS7268795.1 winged helix-turn-helix transcriptional regulator [Candidatus Jordarchaeia archaeon]MBS7278221.1 winged helix-turn-helix transcriptional regulator [Candidatus Jordarchaeia archaeon]